MYYYTKKIAFVLFAGLFLLGCNKDKKNESVTDPDLVKILKLPYSSLTPEEQKVKLEKESLAFLELCNAAQSSPAVEAIHNLGILLDEGSMEFGASGSKSAISVKSVKAAVEYADLYGVFTWNPSIKDWDFTESKSELKFVFPAKKNSKTNNASLSFKLVSSGIEFEDIYLPQSVTCTLTVDNKEAAKIEFSAEYKNNNPVPVKSEFKFTTIEGYSYLWKIEKGDESQFAMKMSYKNQLMFEAMFKTGAKFDQIVDLIEEGKDFYNLLDQVNGYVKLMDDLALAYSIDAANYARVTSKIEAGFGTLMDARNWNSPDFFSLEGKYKKERSEQHAKAFNDYMKVGLYSIKDNYKIADVIAKSEKDENGGYWDCYYWNAAQNVWEIDWTKPEAKLYDEYTENPYFKFGDRTEIAASVYFSDGFDDLHDALSDFIKSLE